MLVRTPVPPRNQINRGRLALILGVFVLVVVALVPTASRYPQHPDEGGYAWSGVYYLGKVARFDFRQTGSDHFYDPGWAPDSWWALSAPMVGRFVYGGALALTGAQPPPRPHRWDADHFDQRPETRLDPRALAVVRGTAIVCTAVGFALLTWRLGWPAALAALVMVALPHDREAFAVAFAEGPLMFAVGLVALAWGTPLVGIACGIAAATKLSAVGLWPLLFSKRASRGLSSARNAVLALATWTLLTPASWFYGGPLYLGAMLGYRRYENANQTAQMHIDGMANWDSLSSLVYLPARYLMPFELAALLLLGVAVQRMISGHRGSQGDRPPAPPQGEPVTATLEATAGQYDPGAFA
jgi:hypothetical protein